MPGSESDPNVQWGGYSPSNPPHNGTSVGLFQQQDNWGPVTLRMDPTGETRSFFGDPSAGPPGLLQVANWQSLPLGAAAQAVQGSAFPTRYAGWQAGAEAIVNDVLNIPCTGSTITASTPQAKEAIAAAQAELGKPYVWGGGGGPPINGPSGSAVAPAGQVGQPGFDCSGLVQYAFSRAGISLPRTSETQFADVQAGGKLVTSMSSAPARRPGVLRRRRLRRHPHGTRPRRHLPRRQPDDRRPPHRRRRADRYFQLGRFRRRRSGMTNGNPGSRLCLRFTVGAIGLLAVLAAAGCGGGHGHPSSGAASPVQSTGKVTISAATSSRGWDGGM